MTLTDCAYPNDTNGEHDHGACEDVVIDRLAYMQALADGEVELVLR